MALENLVNNFIKRLSNRGETARNNFWMKKGNDKQYSFTIAAEWPQNSSHIRPICSGDVSVVISIPNSGKITFFRIRLVNSWFEFAVLVQVM